MLIIDQLKKGELPLRVVALGILAGMGLLAAGLFHVQVLSASRYRTSQASQSFRTVRLPAVRGRIFDVNGMPLAENRPTYNVNLYLEELRESFQSTYKERTAGQRLSVSARAALGSEVRYGVVSNLVGRAGVAMGTSLEVDAREFRRHYNERLALPLTVAKDLGMVEVARYMERGGGLPGLELEVQSMRTYPYGSIAAHILGHLRRDDRPQDEDVFTRYSLPDFRGAAGIEAYWEGALGGRPGVKSVLVNNLGYRHSETIWEPALPGANIFLTLDVRVQKRAEEVLRSQGAETRGAIVVMDVHSGDLLAMASAPTFDPNDFVPGISTEKWQLLLDEYLAPQFNRATGMHAPGSIFKIVVGLAALESGTLRPEEIYHSPGYYLLGTGDGKGRKIKDTANGGMPADFDFRKAFKLSSNAYFVHYGLMTGLDDIVALGQRLHLGETTGLPVLRSQELAGIFPTPDWRSRERGGAWYDGDTANLSIGQGYIAVTPVQMAVMTSAVANGGKVLWPRLVARVEPQDAKRAGEAVRLPPARVRDHLGVSERSLRIVREAMLADVEDRDGTGRQAGVEGYRVAAKTGTAQARKRGRMDHITWFVAFGPYEEPEYAVVVMVESGRSGGETCAPLAGEMFKVLRDLKTRPLMRPELARVD
ncbi:MAG: penicillin-binding transpeptidase domain-containing protein [Limisphaerales bacterium]